MDTVIFLLGLSLVPQCVVLSRISISPVVELVSGDSRIFSGENVRLKCTFPNEYNMTWSYLWFKGAEKLPQTEEHLFLWNVRLKESGKIYCQGVRDSLVGNLFTFKSLPFELHVDGGWAILQVPPHPKLVGDTLKLTCRVRAAPQLDGVILYKNGDEVMRRRGPNPTLSLTDLVPEDTGMYSCRASWFMDRHTWSVISAEAPVQVLEVLSQPLLEIVTADSLIPPDKMKLICHVQYNIPAPAPPVHYYFYKDKNRLGTATSENRDVVRQTPGQYSCRARVAELGLSKWSEPKSFGRVSGPHMRASPELHPEDTWPLVPPISFPDSSMHPEAESTTSPTSLKPATSTFMQQTDVSAQTSDPPQLPTLQPSKTTSSLESGNAYEGSGDSDDMPEGSDQKSGDSDDLP